MLVLCSYECVRKSAITAERHFGQNPNCFDLKAIMLAGPSTICTHIKSQVEIPTHSVCTQCLFFQVSSILQHKSREL